MAATSRPSTQSRKKEQLTDDDFLFVPPATARTTSSSQSPRKHQHAKNRLDTHRTIVGLGTVGLGPAAAVAQSAGTSPAASQRPRTMERRPVSTQVPRPPPRYTEPTLEELKRQMAEETQERTRRLIQEEKRLREEREEQKAEAEELRRQAIVEERKALKEHRERQHRDDKEYVRNFVREQRDAEAQKRELSHRLRERDQKLVHQWNGYMAGLSSLPPAASAARRKEAVQASLRTRRDLQGTYPEGSPIRRRAELLRVLRNEVQEEDDRWEEVREKQHDVDQQLADDAQQIVREIRERARAARARLQEERKAQAHAQRQSMNQYRDQWGKEKQVWDDGRHGEAQEIKRSLIESREQALTELGERKQADFTSVRDQVLQLKHRIRTKSQAEEQANHERAKLITQNVRFQESRNRLVDSRREHKKEIRLESLRLSELRDSDHAQDVAERKAIHDTVRTDYLTSRSRSQSPRSPTRGRPGASADDVFQSQPPPPGVRA
jgi:hypothetical protein